MTATTSDESSRSALRSAIEGVLSSSSAETYWQRLAGLNLVGLGTPEHLGGAGGSLVDLGTAVMACAVDVTPVPLLSSALAVRALAQAADVDAELIASCSDGSRRAVVVHGVAAVPCAARRNGDSAPPWAITGTVRLVPDASGADLLMVSADTPAGQALFAVHADSPGTRVNAVPSLDWTRPTATIELASSPSRMVVPAAEWAPRRWLQEAAALVAADSAGGARGVLYAAVEHAKTRKQFGRPIGSFQAVKHRLADMSLVGDAAATATEHALTLLAADHPEAGLYASVAKYVATDNYLQIAAGAVQVFGGIGFTWEHSAHLHLKRAQANSQLYGTSDEHLLAIADRIGL